MMKRRAIGFFSISLFFFRFLFFSSVDARTAKNYSARIDGSLFLSSGGKVPLLFLFPIFSTQISLTRKGKTASIDIGSFFLTPPPFIGRDKKRRERSLFLLFLSFSFLFF